MYNLICNGKQNNIVWMEWGIEIKEQERNELKLEACVTCLYWIQCTVQTIKPKSTHTHTHVAMDRGMVWPGSFYCLQTHTQRDIGNFGGYLHNFRNRWIFHRRLNIKFQNCAPHLCEYIVFIIRECFFFFMRCTIILGENRLFYAFLKATPE